MDVRSTAAVILSLCVRSSVSGYHEQYRVPHMCSDKYETYIFKSKQYVIENFPASWEDAEILCRGKHNGSLAVLNSAERAEFIAEALAESQFSLESVWVGARRASPDDPLGYRWSGGSPLRRTAADVLVGEETYAAQEGWFPVWLNRTSVPAPAGGADCVAVDRVYHDRPVLLDLPCRLQRAFVCETDAKQLEPIAEQRAVRCRGGLYRVFSGRQTWDEAAAFCVTNGMRLANIFSTQCLKKLGLAMLRSRPSIESAWVGARGADGAWSWRDSGAAVFAAEPRPGRDWPPLRESVKPEGCVQLDRHAARAPALLEARCERRLRFICYESTLESAERRLATAAPPSDDNYYYILVRRRLSWQHAVENCLRMNGSVAFVETHDVLVQLLLVMGENREQPISHSWLSGQRKVIREPHGGTSAEWVNPATGKRIPRNKLEASGSYVPPWLEEEEAPENACLNLDRQDHLTGLVYGVPCATQQHSICMIEKHPRAASRNRDASSPALTSATYSPIETSSWGLDHRLYQDITSEVYRENYIDRGSTRDTRDADKETTGTTERDKTRVGTDPITETNSNTQASETNNNFEKETTSHIELVTSTESSKENPERETEKNYADKAEPLDKQETVDKNEADKPEGDNNLN